jgi:hypothetical protein
MSVLLRNLTLLLAAAVAYTEGATAHQVQPNQVITLRIVDNADAAKATLAEAQTEVARILALIDIRTVWLDSLAAAEAAPQKTTFLFTILNRETSKWLPHTAGALGTTPGAKQANRGHVAYIHYDQVRNVSLTRKFHAGKSLAPGVPRLLAYAIVHELGHLILPVDAHSASGIMKPLWGVDEYKQMSLGLLSFTPQQAELIRSELARRSRDRSESQL